MRREQDVSHVPIRPLALEHPLHRGHMHRLVFKARAWDSPSDGSRRHAAFFAHADDDLAGSLTEVVCPVAPGGAKKRQMGG